MEPKSWVERLADDDKDDGRSYEQERLLVDAAELICEGMASAGLTKADVARMLGSSRAHVTQLLAGSRNMTLRSLADLTWSCGFRVGLSLQPTHDALLDDGWEPSCSHPFRAATPLLRFEPRSVRMPQVTADGALLGGKSSLVA